MVKRTEALVMSDILQWARKSADYSVDEAALRLKKL